MGRSENTIRIYSTDLQPFVEFVEARGLDLKDFSRRYLRSYLAWLSTSARGDSKGYARISVSRKMVALRAFYRYLTQQGVVENNPIPKGRSFNIKVEKKLPTFLGRDETDRLLEAVDVSSPSGVRDRTILEMLYSTGMRLSEISSLDRQDVDLSQGTIRVTGKGSELPGPERVLHQVLGQRLQGANCLDGRAGCGVVVPLPHHSSGPSSRGS